MDFNSLLDFLNSPFAGWVFPTMLVGLIAFSYKKFDEVLKEKRRKRTEIEELDIEISYRIFRLINSAKDSKISSNSNYHTTKSHYIRDFIINNKTNSIYTKFRDETTYGLMIRLSNFLDNKEKKEVRDSGLKLIELNERYSTNYDPIDSVFEQEIYNCVATDIFLKRWLF